MGPPAGPGGGTLTVRCRWAMRPAERSALEAAAGAAGAAGAGVGEVGGGHWFAADPIPTPTPAGPGPGGASAEPGGPGPAAAAAGEGASALPEGQVLVEAVYEVHGWSGLVLVDWTVDARGALPAPLAPGLTRCALGAGAGSRHGHAHGRGCWCGSGRDTTHPDMPAMGASAGGEVWAPPHGRPTHCGAHTMRTTPDPTPRPYPLTSKLSSPSPLPPVVTYPGHGTAAKVRREAWQGTVWADASRARAHA